MMIHLSTHLNMYAVRTDLALEARELVSQTSGEKIPGLNAETKEESGVTITSLQITTEHAAQTLGKPMGHYLTIETPQLRDKDSDLQHRISTLFAHHFAQYLHKIGISKEAKVLIVGLGNWNVTPDALGPMVVENVLVTRHYFELMPDQVEPGYRQVSAIAPGVLGITGIETSEIVRGIVDKSKPDVVIAIDALASKALERVNTTIQIANTGIHPGSGVGNKRKGLTEQELGIPVIAIGVPTVVYASTIVNSTIEMLLRNFEQQTEHTGAILGLLSSLTETERLEMVKEVLDPLGHNLLVTPKEIDQFIEDMAHLIATGLNAALHEAVHQQNVGAFTH
jgi:spore protease